MFDGIQVTLDKEQKITCENKKIAKLQVSSIRTSHGEGTNEHFKDVSTFLKESGYDAYA